MDQSKDMSFLDEEIGFNTVRTSKYITRLLNQHLKSYGLTAEQWTVLKRLHQRGNMSQKHLSEASDKDQATVTKILDLLEAGEFLERKRNPEDRRSFVIGLTKKGEALTEQLYCEVDSVFQKIVNGISEKDIDTYRQVLSKLHRNMKSLI
ncbi:transcriptional regulator [Pullulanibacillus camelliae]|uniref:Transcriptional regulator n=1 Tax=Pullulanibacillus camelliae TaxID=1707096 RepID=A0A8J2VSS3_9BACL|nr:MarR family transcriptional regulator [Pullulanibacillus camelliae]GGE37648.1 transcriptional regulator [Pullulanibacillus camelliae]